MQGKHHRIYDRAFGKDSKFLTEASPYHRLTTAPAPILVVCSTRRNEAFSQAQPFASKAVKLGGRVVILPVDMKHGEINKEPGFPIDYAKYRSLLDAEKALLGTIDLPYLLR